MKTKYLTFRRYIIISLLGLLGIGVSSCEKYGCPEDEIELMYGCPTTEFNDSL